jgi:hypothetical protein
MAGALDKNTYKWKWDYRVRQIFSIAKPVDATTNKIEPFTESELRGYRSLAKLIKSDLQSDKSRNEATLKSKVSSLKSIFNVTNTLDEPDVRPANSLDQKVMLNNIFDEVNLPKDSDQGEPAKPKGRPQLPMPTPPAPPLAIEPNDNIVLAADAPTIYDAIKEADIRAINLETKSPAFNPEQTFSVTITPSVAGAITVNLTPIQYAALAGLKGVVRLLLKQKVDPTKRIMTEDKTVNKPILQAVKDYRKNDEDKADVVYIFMIVNRAIQDATDDYSSGVPLDKKYGEGLAKDVDKSLAKLLYDREYKELETPTQPLPTAVKTTSVKVEEAKKKGKEDAEMKEPRDSAYAVGSTTKTAQEIAGYNAEYTKVRVGKDAISGKEDGEKGYPINPEYITASTTKTDEEKKAYGQAYDKARATYQGEKDALLNEDSKFAILESQLSIAYTDGAANPEHKKTVQKLYDIAYEANRGKTADLVKEAGYVGAYPPSETVLSGNFFGFGSDLNKLIGFDTSGKQPVTDTYAKYKEGLVEFVKNLQSVIGQAKYAGYMDGLKKAPKYTTPGRISVKGKEYAIDFGKLNTRITELPALSDAGGLQETAEFGEAQRILTELRRMRDSSDQANSLQGMITYLRSQLDANNTPKIKQILKTIAVSQPVGGRSVAKKARDAAERAAKAARLAARAAEAAAPEEVKTGKERRRAWNEAAAAEGAPGAAAEGEGEAARLAAEGEGEGEGAEGEGARLAAEGEGEGEGAEGEGEGEGAPGAAAEGEGEAARLAAEGEAARLAAPTLLSKAKTAIAAVPGKIAAVPGKIAAVPGQIVTGLGAVTTKTQLYDLVNNAFSTLPKYVENPVANIPKGVAPDDPSLSSDVHPIKRIQAVYDREFERGTKEGLKKGGTRRKSRKSTRLTKKQKSKK